jgi:hypothetical protein
VAVSAGLAYITTDSLSGEVPCLKVLGVSPPGNIAEVGSVELPTTPHGRLDVCGGYAYVAGRAGGFVADVSNPEEPELVENWSEVDSDVYDVTVTHDLAFISTESGLRVLDLSGPEGPVEVGRSDLGRKSVVISGQHAFAVGDGVSVFDILSCLCMGATFPKVLKVVWVSRLWSARSNAG